MHANPIAAAIIAAGPIKILDQGHVAFIDVMGSDASIASAARASFGNEGNLPDRVKDRGLIRRLMRDVHTSPFEMAELIFHVKAPIHVARQWVRHRTASWSERSARYAEMPPDQFQRTEPDAWRLQDPGNKQGSAGMMQTFVEAGSETPGGWNLTRTEEQIQAHAFVAYRDRIDAGVSREQARKDMPLSSYTQWVWKCDLHNLLHFLRLRLAPDAQLEIRQYAQAIATMVEQLFPATWEAFVDYRLEAMTLSRLEVDFIKAFRVDRVTMRGENPMSDRERAECRAKLARLGLVAREGGPA